MPAVADGPASRSSTPARKPRAGRDVVGPAVHCVLGHRLRPRHLVHPHGQVVEVLLQDPVAVLAHPSRAAPRSAPGSCRRPCCAGSPPPAPARRDRSGGGRPSRARAAAGRRPPSAAARASPGRSGRRSRRWTTPVHCRLTSCQHEVTSLSQRQVSAKGCAMTHTHEQRAGPLRRGRDRRWPGRATGRPHPRPDAPHRAAARLGRVPQRGRRPPPQLRHPRRHDRRRSGAPRPGPTWRRTPPSPSATPRRHGCKVEGRRGLPGRAGRRLDEWARAGSCWQPASATPCRTSRA